MAKLYYITASDPCTPYWLSSNDSCVTYWLSSSENTDHLVWRDDAEKVMYFTYNQAVYHYKRILGRQWDVIKKYYELRINEKSIIRLRLHSNMYKR